MFSRHYNPWPLELYNEPSKAHCIKSEESIFKGLILCCMFEISPGGGAFTLIRRLGSFFFFGGGGGVKILNFNFLGVFQKKNGVWRFCGYFWGDIQNWTIFRGHFYAFYGLFLRSRYQMGDIFWVATISNIFRDAWNSWFFGVYSRCRARAYVWRKNESNPPPYPLGCHHVGTV